MPIEFRCPACDKLLRTSEDKAGLTANCPDCGELVTVPTPAQQTRDERFTALPSASAPPPAPPASTAPSAPPSSGPVGVPLPATGSAEDWIYGGGKVAAPATSPAAQPTRPCPVCGETILAAARVCKFCGEKFDTLAQAGASNGLAIASLITGILSIPLNCVYCGGVPLAIAAIVTGAISLSQCKRGEATGKGMATAGIVSAVSGLVLMLVIVVVLVIVGALSGPQR
jgi:phage FluMu protein Com